MTNHDEIDHCYESVKASDRIVAITLAISEVAQIARIEARLRQYLNLKWNVQKLEAARRAAKLAEQGASEEKVKEEVRNTMREWVDTVRGKLADEMESIYKLSRTALWKKFKRRDPSPLTYDLPDSASLSKAVNPEGLPFEPKFDLADEKAIQQLQQQQMMWIGRHYGDDISGAIGETVRNAFIEGGESRALVGALLLERIKEELSRVRTPDGWNGTQEQYFEGLVSNAATTARAQGQIRSIEEVEVKTYEITNPEDEKTCPICSYMSGKTFQVSSARRIIDDEMDASSPDDVRDAHPWINEDELNEIVDESNLDGKDPTEALSSEGVALPPFHWSCRCSVDISVDVMEEEGD